MPPTAQQLQQQQDQAIQNESNTAHNNLSQTHQQIQSQAQQPTLNRSDRAVAHPPGYIPMPITQPLTVQTSRLFCTAAAMKLVNSGCGSSGRDFSSG